MKDRKILYIYTMRCKGLSELQIYKHNLQIDARRELPALFKIFQLWVKHKRRSTNLTGLNQRGFYPRWVQILN